MLPTSSVANELSGRARASSFAQELELKLYGRSDRTESVAGEVTIDERMQGI
jgi:hypothetical protein